MDTSVNTFHAKISNANPMLVPEDKLEDEQSFNDIIWEFY